MGFKDKLKAAADKAVGDVVDSAKGAVEDIKDAAVDAVEGAVDDALTYISDEWLDLDFLKSMTSIATNAGPAAVAHLALNLGSMNENFDLFLNTLTNDCWRGSHRGDMQWLERKVNSWWKTMNGRKYVFSPEETKKITTNTDTEFRLFFKADDGASVKNKPISLKKEDGVWRVSSITP